MVPLELGKNIALTTLWSRGTGMTSGVQAAYTAVTHSTHTTSGAGGVLCPAHYAQQ